MPRSASKKRERQYEQIKGSDQKQGRSAKRVKQLARATVNKERARTGEAKSSSRSSRHDLSSGHPRRTAVGTKRPTGRTKEQLENEAKRRGIRGRSKINRAQLQRALAGNGR